MSSKKKPASSSQKPVAKVDPDSAFWSLDHKLRDLRGELAEAKNNVDKARRAVADAERQRDHVAAKMLRVITLVGDQVEAAAAEKPTDAPLLQLLKNCKQAPWVKLQRAGASDEQILTILKTGWPHYRQAGRPHSAEGGNSPRAWIHRSEYGDKPSFEGKALAIEARRLMKIPTPKATAAAKPAAKPGPAKAGGSGGGQAKPAAPKKPAPKPTAAKPAAAAKHSTVDALPLEGVIGGFEQLNIDTIPVGLGLGWIYVQQIGKGEVGEGNWRAGYRVSAKKQTLNAVQKVVEAAASKTRREAVSSALYDLIEDIDGRGLDYAESKLAEALTAAIDEYRTAFLAAADVAVDDTPGSVEWAKSIGFDKCSPARAKTIAALPESLRHLMRDSRAGDDGFYGSYQPRLIANPSGVGEAHAFTLEDGDGQIHAGWSLYFTRPALGDKRSIPHVTSRHATMQEALAWAVDQMREAARQISAAGKDNADRLAMFDALIDARADVGKEAARGVGVQPAKPAAAAKSKSKANGKHGPQQAGFMPVGAGAAAAALPS